jgi:hypothetical protein
MCDEQEVFITHSPSPITTFAYAVLGKPLPPSAGH